MTMLRDQQTPAIESLIFVGFNSRLVALDRDSGDLIWEWKSRAGTGFVAVLLDGDRLIVSVQGYTYCLNPSTGEELWYNPLKGKGTGIPCLTSVRALITPQLYAVLAKEDEDNTSAGS